MSFRFQMAVREFIHCNERLVIGNAAHGMHILLLDLFHSPSGRKAV
jgi:hypothetical protein